MRNLILAAIILAFVACTKEHELASTFLDCDQVKEHFTAYNGEEIKCQSFYRLTEYNNQNYIQFDNFCADLIRPSVINENCEDICENPPYAEDSECALYLLNREVKEVILIRN